MNLISQSNLIYNKTKKSSYRDNISSKKKKDISYKKINIRRAWESSNHRASNLITTTTTINNHIVTIIIILIINTAVIIMAYYRNYRCWKRRYNIVDILIIIIFIRIILISITIIIIVITITIGIIGITTNYDIDIDERNLTAIYFRSALHINVADISRIYHGTYINFCSIPYNRNTFRINATVAW